MTAIHTLLGNPHVNLLSVIHIAAHLQRLCNFHQKHLDVTFGFVFHQRLVNRPICGQNGNTIYTSTVWR